MDWLDEVMQRLKKKNALLFSKDSLYLQDLAQLFREQEHRVLILWALDMAAESIRRLEEMRPGEIRPQQALKAAWDWAAGNIKMREAQRKILDCHAVAKEINDPEGKALCHAVGQACAVVHTPGHAMGYPLYDLTALVYRLGVPHCTDAVARRRQEYVEKLFYWQEHWADTPGQWAGFLLK